MTNTKTEAPTKYEAEEFAEKAVTQQASLECVARGYCDPAITFELGAIWQRRRHNPLCACGETSPGPCIRRYPEGHNAVKCTAPMTCQVCALAIEAPQGDEGRAKECQLCGSTIPASRLDRKPGSRPKYCSPQCYEKARRSRRQATVKAALNAWRPRGLGEYIVEQERKGAGFNLELEVRRIVTRLRAERETSPHLSTLLRQAEELLDELWYMIPKELRALHDERKPK